MKGKRLFLLLGAFAAFTMMCVNLDTEYFTKNKPKRKDLVGKYYPTEDTLKFISDEGNYTVDTISIQLYPDGTSEVINMPDWLRSASGESGGKLNSWNGKWDIVKMQDWWKIELGSGIYPIAGDKPPYQIWFYIGDPDNGNVMIFEQTIEK